MIIQSLECNTQHISFIIYTAWRQGNDYTKNSSLHFITSLYTVCCQDPREKAVARNVKEVLLDDKKR